MADATTCAICLEAIDSQHCTLECKHCFHSRCIIDACLRDARCPICREVITSAPAPRPRVVEISFGDLNNAVEEDVAARRRAQRNFDARRRRFVQSNEQLRHEQQLISEARRDLREIERELSARWMQAQRELWCSEAFAELKAKRTRVARRARRRQRLVERAVYDALGERPSSDLDEDDEASIVRTIARLSLQRDTAVGTSADAAVGTSAIEDLVV